MLLFDLSYKILNTYKNFSQIILRKLKKNYLNYYLNFAIEYSYSRLIISFIKSNTKQVLEIAVLCFIIFIFYFFNLIYGKNDLLILNNTKVFPARLFATKDRTDAKVEVFLLRELAENLWEVMVRPARKVRIGNKLVFTPKLMCDVIDNTVSGGRVVRFESESQEELHKIIDKIGTSPLPPYITRDPEPSDKKRYQPVYASQRGAVAAPTAGLHFTDALIKKIEKKIKILDE